VEGARQGERFEFSWPRHGALVRGRCRAGRRPMPLPDACSPMS
jgi:hypothetical protein